MGNAAGKKKIQQYTEFPLKKSEKEVTYLGQIPTLFSFTADQEIPYLCTMQPKQQNKTITFAVTEAEHYYEKIVTMEELREMKDALENNKAPITWWEFFTALRHTFLSSKKIALTFEAQTPTNGVENHRKKKRGNQTKYLCKLHMDLKFEKLGRTVLALKLYEQTNTAKLISQTFLAPFYQFYSDQISFAMQEQQEEQKKASDIEESEQRYKKKNVELKKELQRANERIQQLEEQLKQTGSKVNPYEMNQKILNDDEVKFPNQSIRRYLTIYKKRILSEEILTTTDYYALDKMISAIHHYSTKTSREQKAEAGAPGAGPGTGPGADLSEEVFDFLKNRFQSKKRKKSKKKSHAINLGEESKPLTANSHVAIDREQVYNMFDRIDEWNFDVFTLNEACNGHALLITSYSLFVKYDLLAKYQVNEKVFLNFIRSIEDGYQDNPYHNALHACDVLQVLHVIISRGGLRDFVKSHYEIFGSLLAAIVHDFDHPGLNNPFQINSGSYLAILYNDRSVLENHHVAHAFDLMRHNQHNILASMDDGVRKAVRELCIGMVLATDMNNHAKYVAKFKMRLDTDADFTDEEDLRLALQIGIKMADVSNPTRPLFIYLRWTEKILEEFFAQGDLEKELSIPVSPLMDRKHSKVKEGQIAFIKYVISPMFELWKQLCPRMGFSLEYIKVNQRYWETHEAIDPRDFKEQPLLEVSNDLKP